jgi:hypothetical protein
VDSLLDVEDEEWSFIADRLADWLAARGRASDPLTWDMVESLRDDIRQALDRVGFSGVV